MQRLLSEAASCWRDDRHGNHYGARGGGGISLSLVFCCLFVWGLLFLFFLRVLFVCFCICFAVSLFFVWMFFSYLLPWLDVFRFSFSVHCLFTLVFCFYFYFHFLFYILSLHSLFSFRFNSSLHPHSSSSSFQPIWGVVFLARR